MSTFELWEPVLAHYDSLAPETWLDYSVVNYVLMKHYYSCYPNVSATYVDSYSLELSDVDANIRWRISYYGIPRFRRRSLLSTQGSCPIVPKVFVIRQHQHFFVVYMDHERRSVIVFGRTSKPQGKSFPETESRLDRDNWEEWKGPELYRHICFLHGWNPGSTATVTVRSVNWKMNGVDCGPIAILTAQYLIQYGFSEHAARNLTTRAESCHHITRLKIFQSLQTWMMDSVQNYTYLRSSPPQDWLNLTMSDLHVVYRVLDPPHLRKYQELQSSRNVTLQQLNTHMSGCVQCMRITRASEPRRRPPVPPDSNFQDVEEAPRDRLSIPGLIQDERGVEPHELLVEQSRSQRILDELEQGAAEALENSRTRRLHIPKVNWSEMSIERRKRTARPCDLPLPSRPLWPAHDSNYDDYWGGPTKEDTRAFEDPIHAFSLYDPLLSSVHFKSPWTGFRDHGPRLTSRYAHSYYLCRPMLLENHVMPLVPEYNHQSSIRHFQDMHLTPRPIGRTGIPELRLVSSQDIKLLGAKEMLEQIKTEEGEDIDSNKLLSYFVRGRTQAEDYVCVDLERDGINPMDLKINLSVDIDSFVWVSDLIKVASPVGLMVTPSLRNNPGIKKHNHVYVEILEPLTDLEAAQPTRPWMEQRVPLSNIPNTLFTKITEGNSPIYCYIFFPRMIHRQEYTGRRATYLPLEILVWFWNRVVLPALRFVIDSTSREPFYEFSVNEYSRKRAGKKAAGDDSLYSGFSKQVDPITFLRLQHKMRDILEEASNVQQMDRFKSFFFVVECKGFKLNVISNKGETVMKSLKHNVPQMDWGYVLDRTNGEVHMDVGFTYHPQRAKVEDKDKSGVTGLWRMGYLEESFAKGGYKAGTAHPINTLAGFGALQAEMTRERSQRVHITHRSAYNVVYEAVRKKDNEPWFCGDADAYNLGETFLSACDEKSKQYSNRGSRSYGVRDEYRVSGQAAIDILGSSEDVVSLLMIFK